MAGKLQNSNIEWFIESLDLNKFHGLALKDIYDDI